MSDVEYLAPSFLFLKQRGFSTTITREDHQNFGNTIVVMSGTLFSLKFERERGQTFVDAGNDIFGWHKLENILEFVNKGILPDQLGEPPNLSTLAELTKENWSAIEAVFRDASNVDQLRTFSSQKAAMVLKKIFPTYRPFK